MNSSKPTTLALSTLLALAQNSVGMLFVDFGSSNIAPVAPSTTPTASPVDPAATSGNIPNAPAPVAGSETNHLWGTFSSVAGLANPATVTVRAIGTTALAAANMRAIQRGPTIALGNITANPSLFHDWIGVTQQIGATQTSAFLQITVSGLADGAYEWTSWHHDTSDQTGILDWRLGSASGKVDISNGTAFAVGAPANSTDAGVITATNTPSTLVQSFTIAGGGGNGSIVFELDPQVARDATSGQSVNFSVINGFTIAAIPEPSTALVSALGLGLMLARRRRR